MFCLFRQCWVSLSQITTFFNSFATEKPLIKGAPEPCTSPLPSRVLDLKQDYKWVVQAIELASVCLPLLHSALAVLLPVPQLLSQQGQDGKTCLRPCGCPRRRPYICLHDVCQKQQLDLISLDSLARMNLRSCPRRRVCMVVSCCVGYVEAFKTSGNHQSTHFECWASLIGTGEAKNSGGVQDGYPRLLPRVRRSFQYSIDFCLSDFSRIFCTISERFAIDTAIELEGTERLLTSWQKSSRRTPPLWMSFCKVLNDMCKEEWKTFPRFKRVNPDLNLLPEGSANHLSISVLSLEKYEGELDSGFMWGRLHQCCRFDQRCRFYMQTCMAAGSEWRQLFDSAPRQAMFAKELLIVQMPRVQMFADITFKFCWILAQF